jgi:xylose isomerase
MRVFVDKDIMNDTKRLEGKNIVITGGGIGYETTKALVKMSKTYNSS